MFQPSRFQAYSILGFTTDSVQRLCKQLVVLACLGAANLSFASIISIPSGGLPRDYSQGYFDVTITIESLTDTELTTGAADANKFTDRLALKLPDLDSSTLKFTAAEALTTNAKFFAELTTPTDPLEEKVSDNNTRLTYHVRIQQAQNGEMKTQGDAGKLKRLSIIFKLAGSQVGEEKVITLSQENYVINAEPAFDATAIVGSNRSLRVQWQVPGAVAIKGADGTKTPSGISIFLVDTELVSDGQSLPAKAFTPSASSDTATTCTYNAPSSPTDATACIECPADAYLDTSAVKSLTGFSVLERVDVSNAGASFTGLVNNRPYVAFMAYDPSGLQRSVCLTGQPSPNLSLTELNGENEAKLSDFSCFIATAAYGTPLHQDLALFRRFRDETLMSNALGRGLVQLYYTYSPPIADFIAQHPSLRAGVRSVLENIAAWLRSQQPDSAH